MDLYRETGLDRGVIAPARSRWHEASLYRGARLCELRSPVQPSASPLLAFELEGKGALIPLPFAVDIDDLAGSEAMLRSSWRYAGINRHGVEDARALQEGNSEPLGPEFCTENREALREA
jgi:hypothetical protein